MAEQKKMKLIYAVKSIEHGVGGAEKVLADVSAHMAANGHDVSVLSFDHSDASSFYSLHENITILSLGVGDASKQSGVFESFKRLLSLRKTVKKNNPDAVIAFMHSMFVPMSLALIGTKTPVIASEHIFYDYYKPRPFEYMMMMIALLFVKNITVLSAGIKQAYPLWVQRKIKVIPNPVCINAPENSVADVTNKTILSVGRLEEQKDQATLIHAFARLHKLYSDWRLRIIGEGSLRSDLEKLVQEHEMSDKVFLPGITKKINDEYAKASFFVLPSLFESFGLVTVEAMSFGLPAVGFAECQGTNEIIVNDVNGVLVSGEDRILELAEALDRLMSKPDDILSMGEAAKKTARGYSSEITYNAWNEMLYDIVQVQ